MAFEGDQLRTPIVMFKEFRAEGIVMTILSGNEPASVEILKRLSLMVEISRYEVNV